MRPIDAVQVLNNINWHHKPTPVSEFESGFNGGLNQAMWIITHAPTLTPPNEPLTQADLDGMDYDKVWIDYGDDGEWALVVSGRIYALAVLEGAGFEDILRDEVDSETMDRPSGNYTVYRCPPEAKDNNVPTNETLTIEELLEMDGEPVWVEEVKHWALIDIEKGGQWDGIPFAVWAENGTKFTYNIKNRGLHCYRRPPERQEDTHDGD